VRRSALLAAELFLALTGCGAHLSAIPRGKERAIPRDLLQMVRDALGDRYQVEREIARGGAARVFAARDREGRAIALKILHPELLASLTAQRFLREISLLATLDHPHIAKLLDYGETDWLLYFTMAFFDGPTLRQHLDVVRRLPLVDALTVADEMLDALAYAHGHGVVHRDVKPENIVLSPEAGTVLVDFGIARAIAVSEGDRVTRSGFTVGTTTYMSPEQAAGTRELDHRSDIYSFGCLCFECLTGQPPFQHPVDAVVLDMHRRMVPQSPRDLLPSLPRALAKVVTKALEKDPGDRWQSAAEMRAALRDAAGG
jgi:serine/threonine-protein kinase